MKKRVLSLLLAAVMLMGLLPMGAMAADPATVFTVTADKPNVDQGEEINFTVKLKTSVKLSTFQLYPDIPEGLTYKTGSGQVGPDAAAAMGVNTADGETFYWQDSNMQLGVSTIDGFDSATDLVLMTFTCTATKGGSYTVNMTQGEDGLIWDNDTTQLAEGAYALTGAQVSVRKTIVIPQSLDVTYSNATLAITDKDSKPKTSAPALSGTDTDGDALTAEKLAETKFSIPASVKGIAVDDKGVVSVTDPIQATAGTVTVTAKLGDVTKTADVTVTKAAPAVTEVKFDEPVVTVIAKPVGSAPNAEVTYTAKVYDQYGAVMSGESVNWSNTNVEADIDVQDNKVVVKKESPTGTFKLTATSATKDTVKAEIEIQVVDILFEGTDTAVTVAAKPTYGMKWSDIVKVDAQKLTAKVGDKTVTGTYKVEDADAYPAAGEQTYTVTFTSTDGNYQDVTVKSAAVTVAKKAITVTAQDQSKAYGAAVELKADAWDVNAADLVDKDTKAVLTVNLATTATATSWGDDLTITGTGTADNYAVTVKPGKLTVTPAQVVKADGVVASLTVSKSQVENAQTLAALGVADQVTLSYKGGVPADEAKDAKYDKDLAAVKAAAARVSDAADQEVVLTLTAATFPEYAVAGEGLTLPATKLTITNKYPIPAEDITLNDLTITYGDELAPTATVADKTDYAGMEYTFTYTDKDGRTVAEPKDAGEYTMTVTAQNASWKGTKDAKLTIAALDISEKMEVTLPEGFAPVYTGKAITPTVTVNLVTPGATTDDAPTKQLLTLTKDYTVAYADNVNAGEATVTVTGAGNYAGSKSVTFQIAKADVSELTPTIAGTAKVGQVLSASLTGVVDDGKQFNWQWLTVIGEENDPNSAENDQAVEDGVAVLEGGKYYAIIDAALDETTGQVTYNTVAPSLVIDSFFSGAELAVRAVAADNANYTGATKVSAIKNVEKMAVAGTITVTPATGKDKIEVGDTVTVDLTNVTPNDALFMATVTFDPASANSDEVYEEIGPDTVVTYTVPTGAETVKVTLTPCADWYTGSVTTTVSVGKTLLAGAPTLAAADGVVTLTAGLTAGTADDCDVVWMRDGVAFTNPGEDQTKYELQDSDRGHVISAKLVAKGDFTGELVVAEGIVVPAAAPDAPVATAVAGDGQITVNWNVPADNGSAILGYLVKAADAEGNEVEATVNAVTRTYTFTGLTNGTEYTITVKAQNSEGYGNDSEAVTATPAAYVPSGGGGGGSVSTGNTSTKTLPDGTKVTTTTYGDGSERMTATKTDGTKITLNTKKDGSASGTVTVPDGTKATVTTTKDGETTAQVTVPAKVDSTNVTIPVKGVTAGTVAVIVKDDGTEQVVRMSSVVPELGVTVKLDESAKLKLVDNSKKFVDVPGHWAEKNVDYVSARDIFNGTDATHFTPDGTMTRGMMATVLYRLDGENKGDVTASFADVAADTWYTDAVAWASDKAIVTGYNETTFAPEDNVTREQLAAMIYRYAKALGMVKGQQAEKLDYVDADSISDWAKESVSWLTANGLLVGKPGNLLDPAGNATRAEVAAILERFVELAVR